MITESRVIKKEKTCLISEIFLLKYIGKGGREKERWVGNKGEKRDIQKK